MTQSPDSESTAPPPTPTICRAPNDLYAPNAKRVIGRLCREFLDSVMLTPTELLHIPEKQHQYLNRGTDYQAAVQKAAVVQAQTAHQNVAQRVRELYNVVDTAVREGGERLKTKPPAPIDPPGFAAFVLAARKAELTEARDFFVNAALAAHLADAKTWSEKIERLRTLADTATDARVVLPLVDEVLSEIVESKAALRELFGPSETLIKFLEMLVDMLVTPKPGTLELPEPGQRLRDFLSRHPVPETRAALLRQLRRSLENKAPLASGMPPADLNAHLQLLDVLIRAGDAVGGENTVDMLFERLPRVLTVETLNAALRPLPRIDDRLIKALEIHRRLATAPGRLQIRQYVDYLYENERLLLTLAKEPGALSQKLQRLTKLHDALVTSGLSGAALTKFAEPVAALQADLIRDTKLFTRIESEAATPAARALLLLDLCAEGAFIQGANLRAAHAQIRKYMQDESFAASLLAGADDKQTQTKRLAELHDKLRRSGLASAPAAGTA
ncbi:MAG TPA: hypothetical protein VMQ11_19670 [Alphaproteobacteria bacterium]|nr:hypothetical protein [Alphaproteobacteria bacterium]